MRPCPNRNGVRVRPCDRLGFVRRRPELKAICRPQPVSDGRANGWHAADSELAGGCRIGGLGPPLKALRFLSSPLVGEGGAPSAPGEGVPYPETDPPPL